MVLLERNIEMMEKIIPKKSQSTKAICLFSMLNKDKSKKTTWPMQSIFMIAKSMRNTIGNESRMDTSNEATVWKSLTVCVSYVYSFLVLLSALIYNKCIAKKFPLTWESYSPFLMGKFIFMWNMEVHIYDI